MGAKKSLLLPQPWRACGEMETIGDGERLVLWSRYRRSCSACRSSGGQRPKLSLVRSFCSHRLALCLHVMTEDAVMREELPRYKLSSKCLVVDSSTDVESEQRRWTTRRVALELEHRPLGLLTTVLAVRFHLITIFSIGICSYCRCSPPPCLD